MENRINEYLDTLFDCGPQTDKAYELRDEMKQNLIEKYHDLLADGMSEEDAYETVISSLGDVSELFDELESEKEPEWQQQARMQPTPATSKTRSRSAILTAIAVALFILSPVSLIMADELGGSDAMGLGFFFAMIATGVGLLIYNRMTRPVVYRNNSATVVEDFREYRQVKQEGGPVSKKNYIAGAINAALWCIMVAAYFIVSFFTMKWYITWVMFLIAAAATSLISLIFCGNDKKKIVGAIQGAFWCLVVAAYFMISFRTFAWHITWIIFLIGGAVSSLIDLITSGGERKKVFGAIQGMMWCGLVALYFYISFRTMAWHMTWVLFLIGAAASVILAAVGKERYHD